MRNRILLTVVLMSVLFISPVDAVTGNSGSANEGFGYYITEACYSADGSRLHVKGFFVNSTCDTISRVKTLRLNINGRDGFVAAQAVSGRGLDALNIKPGAVREWGFVLSKPNNGKDLSRIDYNVDMNLEIGSTVTLQEGIKVYYKGAPIHYDVKPAVAAGRVLIPARLTFERMGADVAWDERSKKVTVSRGDKTVEIEIGKSQMKVNGAVESLQVPAQVIEGRTMIPLRAVATALDCVVNWGDDDKMVVIVDGP